MQYLLQGHSPTTTDEDLEANPLARFRIRRVGTLPHTVSSFILIGTNGHVLIRPEPMDVRILPNTAHGK